MPPVRIRIAHKTPSRGGEEKSQKPPQLAEGKENEAAFEDESDAVRGSAAENYFMQGKAGVVNKARRGKRWKNDHSDGSSDEGGAEGEEGDRTVSLPALSAFVEEASKKKTKAVKEFSKEFGQWRDCYLESGFNICFIGAGSKNALLDLFRSDLQRRGDATAVFEGYHEDASVRNILLALIDFFKIKKGAGRDVISLAHLVTDHLEEKGDVIYLFLHNIDSLGLRDKADQTALAELCRTRWLRLCTSTDHMKATVLWDTHHATLFNFVYLATNTFDFSLKAVMASKSSLLGLNPKNSHSIHTMTSLDVLWQSLAENARKIFRIFFAMTYSSGQGVPFWDLFREARDEFLVSSDAALRQLLVEFEDHRVLNRRRRDDGNENLIACLDRQLVERFMEEKGISLEL